MFLVSLRNYLNQEKGRFVHSNPTRYFNYERQNGDVAESVNPGVKVAWVQIPALP